MNRFERPIPGQSLTTTPKNNPYERPPEITDPEQALQYHLAILTKPEVMEDVIFYLELGVDLVTLVEGITRSAVMGGIHSIDVSLIISPAIHEYIKTTADDLGVEYEEGFEDKEGKKRVTYARDAMLSKKMLDKAKPKAAMRRERKEEPEVAVEAVVVEEMPKGLMARRT